MVGVTGGHLGVGTSALSNLLLGSADLFVASDFCPLLALGAIVAHKAFQDTGAQSVWSAYLAPHSPNLVVWLLEQVSVVLTFMIASHSIGSPLRRMVF